MGGGNFDRPTGDGANASSHVGMLALLRPPISVHTEERARGLVNGQSLCKSKSGGVQARVCQLDVVSRASFGRGVHKLNQEAPTLHGSGEGAMGPASAPSSTRDLGPQPESEARTTRLETSP